MSEGGTIKSRLDKVSKELVDENKLWDEKGASISGWQMGQSEVYVRCEVLALAQIIRDKLGMSEDEMSLYLRIETLKFIQELRETLFPKIDEAKQQFLRQQIVEGIHPNSNPPVKIVPPWEKPK